MQRRLLLSAVPAALVAASLAACGEKKPQFNAIDLTGADYGKDFSLPDIDGRTRSLADFSGKLVVLFFGYTQCPDVCPTTLSEIVQAKKLMGADGDKVQAVFITVDPERDTPQVLKAYMANFDPGFVALHPTPEQLAAIAKDFKVYYKKVDGKNPGSYTMDHSAACYVYDTKGRLRLYTRYGSGPKPLADDLTKLLQA